MSRYRTFMAKEAEVDKQWYVVNAENAVLGRLASEIAMRLRGKRKAIFTPHADTGDFIVVVNADKVRMTGRKLDQKTYYRHSMQPGGLTATVARKQLGLKPEEILRHAVKGMLPKNSLGRRLFKKLKVYAGPNHPHQAQQPQALAI